MCYFVLSYYVLFLSLSLRSLFSNGDRKGAYVDETECVIEIGGVGEEKE